MACAKYAGNLHSRKRKMQRRNLHIVQRRCMPRFGMAATWHKRKVGARLRLAIEAVNKRPADIARQFSVSPSKLGNWMRGDDYPSEWFVVQFCDRFNVSMDYLYRGLVSTAMADPLADALWAAERALPPDPEEAAPLAAESER